MAVPTQPVVGDLGSNEVDLMRRALNGLLDAIFAGTVVDIATLQAAILADPNIVKVVETRNLPRQREFPRRA